MVKRIKKAAAALLVPVVLLTGCAVNFGEQVYDNEEMIGADYDRYNADYFSQSSEGNTLSGSAEKLEGMRTIKKFDSSGEGEISLTYDLNVSSGRAKIALCGAFGPDGAKAVIAAVDNRIPVGYVTHLPEQDEIYRKVFG